jgi:hypothetical protein
MVHAGIQGQSYQNNSDATISIKQYRNARKCVVEATGSIDLYQQVEQQLMLMHGQLSLGGFNSSRTSSQSRFKWISCRYYGMWL